MTKKNDEKESGVAISNQTPVQIGFIIGLLSLVLGGLVFWVWWASGISTKLDLLIAQRNSDAAVLTGLAKDILELKEWRVRVDATGTPAMARQAELIRSELDTLRQEFLLHKATSQPPILK